MNFHYKDQEYHHTYISLGNNNFLNGVLDHLQELQIDENKYNQWEKWIF